MRDDTKAFPGITRRGAVLGVCAAAAAAAIAPAATTRAWASTPAILSGKGTFRRLKLDVARTGERIDTVYWVEGEYIDEAVDAISYLMRDWREDAVRRIAPATLDVLAATHRLLDCEDPIQVISAYRTAKTNALLRSRSRGVARNSYHIKAMAVDMRVESRSVRQIAAAGRSLSAGGVGSYSRSNFVHLDSGPVRDWGR